MGAAVKNLLDPAEEKSSFFSFFTRDGWKGESDKTKRAWPKKTQQELPKRRQEKKASSFIPQCWTLLQTYSHVKNPTVWNDLMIIMLIFKNALLACRKEQVGTHCLRADSVGL